jgi:hypothetical protein
MVTRKLAWSLVLIALLLFLPASIVEVRGQDPVPGVTTDEASSRGCSLARLQGTYGFFEHGRYVGQIGQLPPGPFPVAIAGSVTDDGAGNLSGTYTGSFGGVIVSAPFTGMYTVNPDCTYSDEFAPGPGLVLHTAGTISGDGMFQETDYIYTDAGIVMSGTSKKARPHGCSLETLKGDYALFGEGWVTKQLPPLPFLPPFPTSRSGIVTTDGAGNLTGRLTASMNGLIVSVTFTGTYTVEPDCTVSAEITNSNGAVAHEWGTITGNGEFQEVDVIVTDAGWVFTETLKKQ